MSEKRCGNCRWWRWNGVKVGRISHRDGHCRHQGVLARMRTDVGFGGIYFRADFCCPHHEPREEE